MAKSLPELLLQDDVLYLFDSGEGQIIFRPLTYREYRITKKCLQFYPDHNLEVEDWVWDKCVIEHSLGHSLDEVKAGTVITLLNCILTISSPTGVDQANERLAASREELKDVLVTATVVVCQAFPNYTTKMVEDMHWSDIIKKLAEAEIILGKTLDFKKDTGPPDDSHKIFSLLDRMSEDNLDIILKDRPVDFAKENRKLD